MICFTKQAALSRLGNEPILLSFEDFLPMNVEIIQVGSTSKNHFCFVLKEQSPFQANGSTSVFNGHLRKEERWTYKLWADTGQRLFRSETVQTGLSGFSCGVATMKTKWLRRCQRQKGSKSKPVPCLEVQRWRPISDKSSLFASIARC